MPAAFATRRRHILFAWIATLAILFTALAPMAQAFAGGADAGMAEICRADGGARAVSDDGGRHDPLQHAGSHCPLCASHAQAALLPPPALVLALIVGHDHFPRLFYQASVPLFSWAAAQPRGPPALS